MLEALLKLLDEQQSQNILNELYPPSLNKIIRQPSRIIEDQDFDGFGSGKTELDEFLLDLDSSQEPFVRQFSGRSFPGALDIEGGPGSVNQP